MLTSWLCQTNFLGLIKRYPGSKSLIIEVVREVGALTVVIDGGFSLR
jgi:hypothetical protein